MADNRLLSESDLWFSPSQMREGAKNALLYPFRNPEQVAEAGLSIAPGSGEAMSARNAWDASGRAGNALLQGNYGEAASGYGDMALGIMGALPGAGIIARGTRRGAAWMDRNLPEGINRLLDNVTPSDPQNTLNIFAGPTAKTADHAALAKAQEMAHSGASRDDIWRDTGWFQGVDGKWRFEIDDSNMAVNIPRNKMSGDWSQYKTAIDHPDLFAAYPPMQRNRITFDHRRDDSSILTGEPSPNAFDTKQYDTEIGVQGRIRQDGSRAQIKPNAIREHTAHEAQHNIQSREGFAPGTSPFTVMGELDELGSPEYRQLYEDVFINLKYGQGDDPTFRAALAKLDEMKHQEMMDGYRRTAGEVEARNVASRLNMTAADRRATAPWLTQDVPDDQQIVRYR